MDIAVTVLGSQTAQQATSINVAAGSAVTLVLTLTDSLGIREDITGAKVWATVKRCPCSTDALVTKRNVAAGGSASEIVILGQFAAPTRGQAQVYLDDTDTAAYFRGARFYFDAWMELTGKRVQVAAPLEFVIGQSITTTF